MKTKRVTIPACEEHCGQMAVNVELEWKCPACGGPRGEVYQTLSFDGSRRLGCDGWVNPCGHVDKYSAVRKEAVERQAVEEHPLIKQFWDSLIHVLKTYPALNHSKHPEEIAFNMNEVNKVFLVAQVAHVNFYELRKLLPESKSRRFLRKATIKSIQTNRSIHCWIFED
ncbi:hypothetical protein [Endozoicomonas lisbonensis]|uniref:Uncharacterized protein n=1 Tax=Endozoicomonas lisbonensis TaxID=3120522 RepID=A0ABV2SID3_9GAMM